MWHVRSGCEGAGGLRGQKLDDLLQRVVGLAIGLFELGGRPQRGIGRAIEEAVGQRPTDALVKEDEEEADPVSFVGETVAVSSPHALQEAVALEFAQVITQLGQGVAVGGEAEGGQDSRVDLGDTPASDSGSGMQQHLHEADHAGIVDLDAGDTAFATDNGQGQALKEREVHVDVEGLGLESSKAVGHPGQSFPHLVQMHQGLLESEVTQIVAEHLQAKKGGELLVHAKQPILAAGA